MRIIINEVPLSKNKYVNSHWTKRKEYRELIEWLFFSATGKKKMPHYEKATVTFDIYFRYRRRRDIQNFLGGGLIVWLDTLVKLGIIEDDSYDCIGQPIVRFHIDRDNPRTEIRID